MVDDDLSYRQSRQPSPRAPPRGRGMRKSGSQLRLFGCVFQCVLRPCSISRSVEGYRRGCLGRETACVVLQEYNNNNNTLFHI